MARTHKKTKTIWWGITRLFFVLLLISMLAAYVSNQVTISSKQAELDALNEQIAQQKSEKRGAGTDSGRQPRRDRRVDCPGFLRLCGAQ